MYNADVSFICAYVNLTKKSTSKKINKNKQQLKEGTKISAATADDDDYKDHNTQLTRVARATKQTRSISCNVHLNIRKRTD